MSLDLHLDLQPGDRVGRALENAVRDAVRSGRLAPGTRLTGTRSLATDLGVSRGTGWWAKVVSTVFAEVTC